MLKFIELAFAGDVFIAARPWVSVGVIAPSTPARAEGFRFYIEKAGQGAQTPPLAPHPHPRSAIHLP
jgi:hypothetical protein